MGKPISTINTGKPGRPASVQLRTTKVFADALFRILNNSDLVAAAIPSTIVKNTCAMIAHDLWGAVNDADLRIIPAPVCRELALLVGEVPHASQSLAPVVGAATKE